eukprot:scaffold109603_cov63-Phaeocystis_antarctica.AAC.2
MVRVRARPRVSLSIYLSISLSIYLCVCLASATSPIWASERSRRASPCSRELRRGWLAPRRAAEPARSAE